MLALDLADRTLPETKRLGVRIVDPEEQHALIDPELDHVAQLAPQRLPVRTLEIERVDVLVFLGRILRILNGAVGPPAEPLRMLGHVRMIGRALKSDIERDFDAARTRVREQPPEVGVRAELG